MKCLSKLTNVEVLHCVVIGLTVDLVQGLGQLPPGQELGT